jgi:hypothetical protein
MTEKRETSQGYIIHILQHFATKLRNITNFVMLFQAVIDLAFYLDLSRSKFCCPVKNLKPYLEKKFTTELSRFILRKRRKFPMFSMHLHILSCVIGIIISTVRTIPSSRVRLFKILVVPDWYSNYGFTMYKLKTQCVFSIK